MKNKMKHNNKTPWSVRLAGNQLQVISIPLTNQAKESGSADPMPICIITADEREGVNPGEIACLLAAAPEAIPLFEDLQEYLLEYGGVAEELLERVDAWLAKARGENVE